MSVVAEQVVTVTYACRFIVVVYSARTQFVVLCLWFGVYLFVVDWHTVTVLAQFTLTD